MTDAVSHFDAPTPVTSKLGELLNAQCCTRNHVHVGFGPADPSLYISGNSITVSNRSRAATVPTGLTYKQVAEWVIEWAARKQPEIPDGYYTALDIEAMPDGDIKTWLSERYRCGTSAYPLGGAVKVQDGKVEAWGYI